MTTTTSLADRQAAMKARWTAKLEKAKAKRKRGRTRRKRNRDLDKKIRLWFRALEYDESIRKTIWGGPECDY